MVVTTSNLKFLFCREKPPYLLESLGRNDQIACRSIRRVDRHLHLGETVPIRSNHPHTLRTQLPQHTVEDRPTFLSRYCRSEERRVGKECRSRWSRHH